MTTLWQGQRYIIAIVILLAFLAVVVRILRSSVHEGVIYSKVPQNDVDTVDGNTKGEVSSGWEEWEDPSAVLDVPSPIGSMQTKPEETFSHSQVSNAGKKFLQLYFAEELSGNHIFLSLVWNLLWVRRNLHLTTSYSRN